MSDAVLILDTEAVRRALARVAHEIAERNPDLRQLVLVGVQRGGVHLARRLGELLASIGGPPVPVGLLDVSMHRDDLAHRPNPQMWPTALPVDVTGRTVVLVDDVLFSGRTTRAALDALNDLGRPKSIQLAVLIDRGHRELPIKATFVGKSVSTAPNDQITVQWREDQGTDAVYLEKR